MMTFGTRIKRIKSIRTEVQDKASIIPNSKIVLVIPSEAKESK